MKTTLKVIFFGMISGTFWSFVPGALSVGDFMNSTRMTALVLLSGLLTGATVSLALQVSLAKSNRIETLFLGMGSLPLGAFVFGCYLVLINFMFGPAANEGYLIANLFAWGLLYAFESVFTPFAILLIPLACITTFLLKSLIHGDAKPC